MINEPKALKEIHNIREEIYRETNNMTPKERADFAHTEAQKLISQYNLNISYVSEPSPEYLVDKKEETSN